MLLGRIRCERIPAWLLAPETPYGLVETLTPILVRHLFFRKCLFSLDVPPLILIFIPVRLPIGAWCCSQWLW